MNMITTTRKIFMMSGLIMMRRLTRKNFMGYQNIPKENQITTRINIKIIYEYAEEENDTQYMKMDHPKEEIILDDDEDKDYDFIEKRGSLL